MSKIVNVDQIVTVYPIQENGQESEVVKYISGKNYTGWRKWFYDSYKEGWYAHFNCSFYHNFLGEAVDDYIWYNDALYHIKDGKAYVCPSIYIVYSNHYESGKEYFKTLDDAKAMYDELKKLIPHKIEL
jgi:hypothetical protein